MTTNVSVKPDQDQNLATSGYSGLQLTPGGKGILYLYFKDDGKTVTKLFDTASNSEIPVN